MTIDERQFLMTTMWLFMRHGQPSRARAICEALVENDPRDGVAAVALAGLLLDDGEGQRALEVLRTADIPPEPTESSESPDPFTPADTPEPSGGGGE